MEYKISIKTLLDYTSELIDLGIANNHSLNDIKFELANVRGKLSILKAPKEEIYKTVETIKSATDAETMFKELHEFIAHYPQDNSAKELVMSIAKAKGKSNGWK
jgi:hypothetical protein